MKGFIFKPVVWLAAACICIVLLCMPAEAAMNTGCGHCCDCSDEDRTEETSAGPAVTQAAPEDDGEYYYFNGKKYAVSEYWGEHYLTGYGPDDSGSCMTRSGCTARSGYTVSSTYANLGKTILIKAVRGTSETSDISRYDGIYVCQDTGGSAVENGLPTTMDTPVVDIFFDTLEEADNVTENGWITAKIYILREIE